MAVIHFGYAGNKQLVSSKPDYTKSVYCRSNSSTIAFLDSSNNFHGWKTILSSPNAWVQYNAVDFGNKSPKKIQVRALSKNGSVLQIRMDNPNSPVIAEVKVPKSSAWSTVETKVKKQTGVHNLVVMLNDSLVELDWIQFK